jgi:hypothetical protein
MTSYYKLALKYASKSRHRWAYHVAFVLRGGNCISIGVNHEWRHAEIQALNQLWPNERIGTKLISIKVNKSGKFGLARPCPNCMRYLKESGVKLVQYTNDDGLFVTEKLSGADIINQFYQNKLSRYVNTMYHKG